MEKHTCGLPTTSAFHPINNWLHFYTNIPYPTGRRGRETKLEKAHKEKRFPTVSFLPRVKGYKAFLSKVIFSLLPCPNLVHSQQEQGLSHGAGVLKRRIQIFIPTLQESGGELHSLAKAPGGSVSHLPLPLSPGHTQAQAYVRVCAHTQTHTLRAPRTPNKYRANGSNLSHKVVSLKTQKVY